MLNSYPSWCWVNFSIFDLGSVIQNHGEKTIIMSPAVAAKNVSDEQESKIFISSSSWINIDGHSGTSSGQIGNNEIDNVVTIVNGNSADTDTGHDMSDISVSRHVIGLLFLILQSHHSSFR